MRPVMAGDWCLFRGGLICQVQWVPGNEALEWAERRERNVREILC